jgi:hypothetical protein
MVRNLDPFQGWNADGAGTAPRDVPGFEEKGYQRGRAHASVSRKPAARLDLG